MLKKVPIKNVFVNGVKVKRIFLDGEMIFNKGKFLKRKKIEMKKVSFLEKLKRLFS